ncbi:LysR family transcriptional regulator [Mesobacterium sp. TK19101]|uniref:LysR family transcriptional regulator n=1 Tax=Mesobacterium hydrothermale TaxID=3111907 RepID=A0ABU6HHG0_9RHOB|nr:LysR family transcriptional regulator [Mesobacterium sp. TK19101]MEC3861537.1 LysR family transcriptional regulator [Mesobacterium sp. TK19101]
MPVDPPRPKPPPLNALRAFEAAARLCSFSRAADELAVTPGAVSQQVKALEDWAGVRLFTRTPQGVVLTPAADRILPDVTRAFDGLGQVAQTLRSAAGNRLHIAALPAIAQLWLAPRLPALRAAMPEVTVSVSALEQPPNLLREPFSLSLFLAPEGEGRALARDELFPVCAPDLAKRLQRPEDLAQVPCLSDSTWDGDWQTWIAVACPGLRVSGPSYSLYSMAVAEAVAGAGVLIEHRPLIDSHLRAGTLVQLFETTVVSDNSLTAVAPQSKKKGPTQLALDLLVFECDAKER